MASTKGLNSGWGSFVPERDGALDAKLVDEDAADDHALDPAAGAEVELRL